MVLGSLAIKSRVIPTKLLELLIRDMNIPNIASTLPPRTEEGFVLNPFIYCGSIRLNYAWKRKRLMDIEWKPHVGVPSVPLLGYSIAKNIVKH